jgi:hypothetical protein
MQSTAGLAILLNATKTRKLLEKHVCPRRARLLLLYCGPPRPTSDQACKWAGCSVLGSSQKAEIKDSQINTATMQAPGNLEAKGGICVPRIYWQLGPCHRHRGLVADEPVVLMLVWRRGCKFPSGSPIVLIAKYISTRYTPVGALIPSSDRDKSIEQL